MGGVPSIILLGVMLATILSRLIGSLVDFFNAYSSNLGYQVMLPSGFICLVVGSLLLVKSKEPGLAEKA